MAGISDPMFSVEKSGMLELGMSAIPLPVRSGIMVLVDVLKLMLLMSGDVVMPLMSGIALLIGALIPVMSGIPELIGVLMLLMSGIPDPEISGMVEAVSGVWFTIPISGISDIDELERSCTPEPAIPPKPPIKSVLSPVLGSYSSQKI